MEYSKEDLMEAKKQIWGVGENMGTEESKKIWEENAQFWDNAMGDESNEFHREVVRPKVTELLSPNPADYILDIACGNGNYSSYLAQRGASVVAFDYSKKMIELAKRRQSQYAKQIEFCVADATDRKSILELKRNRAFGSPFFVVDCGLAVDSPQASPLQKLRSLNVAHKHPSVHLLFTDFGFGPLKPPIRL